MTLYEQHDLYINQAGPFLQYFMFYLTLLSAYLVVAFVAGKRLTTFKVWTVSVIYCLSMASTAVAVVVAGRFSNGLPAAGFVIAGQSSARFSNWG